jgi:hypothetical protein
MRAITGRLIMYLKVLMHRRFSSENVILGYLSSAKISYYKYARTIYFYKYIREIELPDRFRDTHHVPVPNRELELDEQISILEILPADLHAKFDDAPVFHNFLFRTTESPVFWRLVNRVANYKPTDTSPCTWTKY